MRGRVTVVGFNIEEQLRIAQQSVKQNSPMAVQRLETIVQQAPNDPRGHMWLGLALSRVGQLERARQSLERAGELAPRVRTVQYNLGLARRDLGDAAAAREAFVAALRAGCDYEPALQALLELAPADEDRESPTGEARAMAAAEGLLRLADLIGEEDAGARENLGADIRWAREELQQHRPELPPPEPIALWRLNDGAPSTAEDATGARGWLLHATPERELWLRDSFEYAVVRRDPARVRARSEGAMRIDEQGYVLEHLEEVASAAGDDGPRTLAGLAELLAGVLLRSTAELRPATEAGQLALAGVLCLLLDRSRSTATLDILHDTIGPLLLFLAVHQPGAAQRFVERLLLSRHQPALDLVSSLCEQSADAFLPVALAAMGATGELRDVPGREQFSVEDQLRYVRQGLRGGTEPQVARAIIRLAGPHDANRLAAHVDVLLAGAASPGEAGENARRDLRPPMTTLGYPEQLRADRTALAELRPDFLARLLTPDTHAQAAAWTLWILKHQTSDDPKRLAPWTDAVARLLAAICRRGIQASQGEEYVKQATEVLLAYAEAEPSQAKVHLPQVLGALRDAAAENAFSPAEKSDWLKKVWDTNLAEPFADQVGRILIEIVGPGNKRLPSRYYDDDNTRALMVALAPLRPASAYRLASLLEDRAKELHGDTRQFVRTLLPEDPGALTRALIEHGTPGIWASLRGSKAQQRLLGLLGRSQNALEKAEIITVLGNIGDPATAEAVADGLDDPNEDLRAAAATALGQLGELDAIPLMKKHSSFLRERSRKVREAAAEALIKLETVRRKQELAESRKQAPAADGPPSETNGGSKA